MTRAGPISAERLQSFIHRIEKLLEERKAIQSDIRDVFSEAKGVGYDVKTMRSLIKLRTIDVAERDEQEQLLDTYAHALGMEVGSPIVTVAPNEDVLIERATRIVREIEACMDILEGDKPPKIEAIKTLIGCSTGKAHKLRTLIAERLSRSNRRTVKMENENSAETGSATVVATGVESALSPDNVPAGQDACTTDAATTQDAAGRTEPPAFDPDRDMPAHLRRKPGEGHGLAPAQKPEHLDERAERATQ